MTKKLHQNQQTKHNPVLRPTQHRARIIQTLLKQLFCLFLTLLVISPIYLVFINSFKTKGEAARMSIALPTEWHFENYTKVIEDGKLIQGFTNSMTYSVLSTAVAVLLCAMAAYVMCRNRSKLNTMLYYFTICGLFIPVNFVTVMKVLQTLRLAETRAGLILVFTSSMIPFCVFTIKSFVSSVPVELDEAAVIDGAGPLQLFFGIIIPLLKPILATAFILEFMGVWNDFITPLYLTSKSSMWPMNLAVYNFFGKNASYWNLVFADIMLTCLPVIIIYLLGQKYIISGLTSGAVKE